MKDTINRYITEVSRLSAELDPEAIGRLADRLEDAWRHGRRVLIMGNGGSAATASHIVNDLQKCIQLETGRALKAICLADSMPLLMAWGNDTEFANVFRPQVECWAEPGDLIIAISGSGNSPNVIQAVERGNELGATTLGLAGFQGGKLAQTANDCIVIPSDNMQQIEDMHMIILHAAFSALRDALKERSA
jgi:D-sedoheptulose 7-phosphate isomerase